MRLLPLATFLLATAAPAQITSQITAPNLLRHIQVLSSDAYTGRHPGTPGETKSVAYLISQCKALGLAPGSPSGTYTQSVPLWGMAPTSQTLTLAAADHPIPLTPAHDYTTWASLPTPTISIPASPLVFAGYGVVAPEYHWDDYANIDVHGKTVLILLGDPPVADPADPTHLDEKMFLGRALTVYGRTGTKLDQAFAHGAAAAILIPAATPANPQFLFANYTREAMTLRGTGELNHVRAQAILLPAAAATLFTATGLDLPTLQAAAAKPGFHAVPLPNAQVSIALSVRVRQVNSRNVVCKIPGSDPNLRNEYLVYSAHWDHHGQVGTQIFHGASDNAAGAAGILEIARALKPLHPKRSVLFLFPTAEEKGLLGARYYVEHPLYPLAQTVANINLDYFSNWGWGRTHDFSIVGLGNSTLDDLTTAAVHAQGRVVTADTYPEQGFYFRSDHYEFARQGVPSIETAPGIDYVGKPAAFGLAKRAEYIGNDYHQPSDTIKPDWDLSGAIEDLQILATVGLEVANSPTRPTWKPNAIWRPLPALATPPSALAPK